MNARSFLVSGCLFATVVGAPAAAFAEPTKQDCVAANESGQDLRRAGRLREARASFAVCTAEACPSAVREDCGQRLKDVEAALPSIVFEVKDREGHDLTNVRVTMDGEQLRDKLNGVAAAVDPGEHHFVFEGEGFRKGEEAVVVREGDQNRTVRVVLVSVSETLVVPEHTGGFLDAGTQRALGIVVGAVGVGGLVVSGVFGLLAKSTYDQATSPGECDPVAGTCSAQGWQDRSTASDQATIATVAAIGGGALLVGGALLFFTAPSNSSTAHLSVAPTVAMGGGGVSLRGSW